MSSWRGCDPWTGAVLTAGGYPDAQAISVFEPTARAQRFTVAIGGQEGSR